MMLNVIPTASKLFHNNYYCLTLETVLHHVSLYYDHVSLFMMPNVIPTASKFFRIVSFLSLFHIMFFSITLYKCDSYSE